MCLNPFTCPVITNDELDFQCGSELEGFCKNSGLDSPCSTTWHVQAGKCVLRVFWFCLYLQSDHFLQCLKSLPFAIWTCFLIFFVASPSSLYCFVLMSLWSFDDFFLNYLQQLFFVPDSVHSLKNPCSAGSSDSCSLWPPQLSWEFLPCCSWISDTFIHGGCGVFSLQWTLNVWFNSKWHYDYF